MIYGPHFQTLPMHPYDTDCTMMLLPQPVGIEAPNTSQTQSHKPKANQSYRPDIDGLRAIAIILVVAFHYFSFHGGFVGVDIFFVISGYLITGIILRETDRGDFRLTDFYARRIRRIFPALFLVLLGVAAGGWYFLFMDEYRPVGMQIAAGATYISNLLFWQQSGYFDSVSTTKPLLHLWSLAIEEQFYLVWPALLLLARSRHRTQIILMATVTLLSFAINIYEVQRYTATAFYLPFSRIWELAAGGLLAWLELYTTLDYDGNLYANISAWLGLALISASLLLSESMPFPGWAALLPVLGAVCVIAAGQQAWFNRRVLSARGMVFIGLISYPLYLWHWPLISFAHLLIMHIPRAVNIGLLLVSIGLAWLTYRYLEQPIRHVSISRYRTPIIAGGLIMALLIAGLGLLISTSTLPPRLGHIRSISVVIPASSTEAATSAHACQTPDGDRLPADVSLFKGCEAHPYPGHPVAYLIGDSHAQALSGELRDYLNAHQINLQSYTVTDCMPFALEDRRQACNTYNQYILDRIRHEKPALVILAAYHLIYQQKWSVDTHYGHDNYLDFLAHNTATLTQNGTTHVLVIGEVPTWENSLPWVLNRLFLARERAIPARTLEGVIPDSLSIDQQMQQLPWGSKVSYLSVKDLLCNGQGCMTMVGHTLPTDLTVFDYGHLSQSGARYVIQQSIGPQIVQHLGN